MQFLRTAFWVVLAIIIVIFSFANWTDVTINLWGGLQLGTKLPVLVIVAFLAGSLPFWALHKATKWKMRRRLDSAERALAASTPVTATPVATTSAPTLGYPADPMAPTPITPAELEAAPHVGTVTVKPEGEFNPEGRPNFP